VRHGSIIILKLIFWLFFAVQAQALTLAVFPIEDLSKGQNGISQEMTEYLAWEMSNKGFDVIAQETVVSFMARNRVRWLGFLDTKNIILAKEEMGADLLLFGNVSEGKQHSLGLALYLVRTSDTSNLWTGSGGLSNTDIVNILGIGEPEDGEGLMPRLAQQVLESWPKTLEYSKAQEQALELEKVELLPTHVQRGNKVYCSVRLRTRWPETDMPRVFFKAAGRVYLAEQSKDGFSYKAEWQVTERDGRYPVTMVINWPSGKKKVSFLGAYNIDSSPPKLVLDLKGVKLEGTVAFRDRVIIVPKMLRREPVARWQLKVEDESGKEQLSRTGYGNLPNRFVWNGRSKDGWPADEGVYNVILQVWDRADNRAVSSQPVAVARTPPAMVLEAKNHGRDIIVDLSHEGEVPIAFWRMEMRNKDGALIKVAEGSDLPVRMDVAVPKKVIKVADGLVPPRSKNIIKVADGQGPLPNKNIIKVADGEGPLPNKNIIKVADGEEPLPNKNIIKVAEGDPLYLDVALPEDKDTRKVECTIIMRDVLGNYVKEKITDLNDLVKSPAAKDGEEGSSQSVWLEEF